MTVTEFTCADCLTTGTHAWRTRYKSRLCDHCFIERQKMDLLVAETAHEDRIAALKAERALLREGHERRN